MTETKNQVMGALQFVMQSEAILAQAGALHPAMYVQKSAVMEQTISIMNVMTVTQQMEMDALQPAQQRLDSDVLQATSMYPMSAQKSAVTL